MKSIYPILILAVSGFYMNALSQSPSDEIQTETNLAEVSDDFGQNTQLDNVLSNDPVSTVPTKDGGAITIATTAYSYGKGKGDILLSKTDANGNEEWFNTFGSTSYDIASSIQITKDGGYIIVGSTSSYGAGNYDIWLIKTDSKGKKEWSKTYGSFRNEYGRTVEVSKNGGYIIEGKKAGDYKWVIETDAKGNLISEEMLD